MPILFEPRPADAEAYSFALGGDVTVVDSLPTLLRAVDQRADEVLVVVGPDIDLQPVLDFADKHRYARPALGVVLLRRRVDAAVLGHALRAGIREVVNADDLTSLDESCRRSREISSQILARAQDGEQPARRGRVMTVFSAKGGCGKTTVATNLASALAVDKRVRVCLVDLDLAFGDVAITMQLLPERTLADAQVMEHHVDEVGVRSLVTPHSSGLDTILAPLEPGKAESLSPTLTTELLHELKRSYDYVIVDTPPAFNEQVLAAFDASDVFILLATLDIPALKNLKLTLEMLEMLGYPRDNWNVVLNRSDAKVGLNVSDVEQLIKAPITVAIPSSRDVPATINRGVPIVTDQPGHAVSTAIKRLAAKLTADDGVTVPAPRAEGAKHGRRVALFRRGGVPA